MSQISQPHAESIAEQYAIRIGFAPFLVDGSTFDDSEERPFWHVHCSYRNLSEDTLSFSDIFTIRVDGLTGEASHVESL